MKKIFLSFLAMLLVCVMGFAEMSSASADESVSPYALAPYQSGGTGTAESLGNKLSLIVDCTVYPDSHSELNYYRYSTYTLPGFSFSALGAPNTSKGSGYTMYTGSGKMWENGSYRGTLKPSVKIYW